VGLIRADVDGLSALAASCEDQAGVVDGVNAAPPVGQSFQATAETVTLAHGDIAATGAMLAARMQSTADDVTIAAFEYSLTEADSASAVSAVGTEV
jgi:hypothetical protein